MARWSATRREQAREAILGAALDVFEAEGVERATLRQIATRAGVGVGTLFNYYPDKYALLCAAFHDELAVVVTTCVATLSPDPAEAPAPLPLCVEALGRFFTYYAARPALSRALLSHALFAQGEEGARFAAQVEQVAMALIAVVERHRLAHPDLWSAPHLLPSPPLVMAILSHYYFALMLGMREAHPDAAQMRAQLERLIAPLFPATEAPRGLATQRATGRTPQEG